jgi:hypothetical protein
MNRTDVNIQMLISQERTAAKEAHEKAVSLRSSNPFFSSPFPTARINSAIVSFRSKRQDDKFSVHAGTANRLEQQPDLIQLQKDIQNDINAISAKLHGKNIDGNQRKNLKLHLSHFKGIQKNIKTMIKPKGNGLFGNSKEDNAVLRRIFRPRVEHSYYDENTGQRVIQTFKLTGHGAFKYDEARILRTRKEAEAYIIKTHKEGKAMFFDESGQVTEGSRKFSSRQIEMTNEIYNVAQQIKEGKVPVGSEFNKNSKRQ